MYQIRRLNRDGTFGAVVGTTEKYSIARLIAEEQYSADAWKRQVDPGLLPRVDWELDSTKLPQAQEQGFAPFAQYADLVILREGRIDRW